MSGPALYPITEAAGQRKQRGTPAVDHSPPGQIAHGVDRQIDRAMDDPDAGETGLRSAS
jgi:hypothetical protein